jgi:branched-chain amino acid transport system permease protein
MLEQVLQQIFNGLALGSIYSLVALGFTLVYGILFMMNLPHGDVYMFGAFACLVLLGALGHFWLAVCLAVMVTAAFGILMEKVAYKPLRDARRLAPLLSALGVSLILENGALLIFGPDLKPFPDVITLEPWIIYGIHISPLQIFIIVVSAILMILLQVFLHKTNIGLGMQAASMDRNTIQLMGMNINTIISTTFGIGSGLAAAAGIQISMYYSAVYPLMGFPVMLKAFAACVLGGIGNVYGAMIGGIVLGMAEVLSVGYLSSGYRDAIAFGVMILVLLFRPWGIMRGREDVYV